MKKRIFICISVVSLVIVLGLLMVLVLFPYKYEDTIDSISSKYDLDRKMVASVINIESGYRVNATSQKGAIGLMQLLPSTAMEVAGKLNMDIDDIDKLYDVNINIEIGCYYLRYLLDYFDGNIINTLCAYNWGMSNVRAWINDGNVDESGTITNIPVKETRDYIRKYKINYRMYDIIH